MRQVADDIAFPNGMAVTADNSTLIVADSYRHQLVGFDIGADGGLSGRRVWADLGDGVPDGICVDAENAVWYADVPNQRCVRVAEGGTVLQTVDLDRGGFACALGGPDRTTLFIVAAQWRGMTEAELVTPGSGQVLIVEVEVPGRRLAVTTLTAWMPRSCLGSPRTACERPRSVTAARRRSVSSRSRPERPQALAACSSAAKPPATTSASTWR